jgi:hypothetical protein
VCVGHVLSSLRRRRHIAVDAMAALGRVAAVTQKLPKWLQSPISLSSFGDVEPLIGFTLTSSMRALAFRWADQAGWFIQIV